MSIAKLLKSSVISAALCLWVMGTGRVLATTTVCSREASRLHHYGNKESIRFTTQSADPDNITEAVKAFADKNGLSYSSVGGFDPYKKPAFRSLDQILQSRTLDVSIVIRTTNRDNIAKATVSTFSFNCAATEDWRPYWQKLRSFIAIQKYSLVATQ
jgi:hypothetical protein